MFFSPYIVKIVNHSPNKPMLHAHFPISSHHFHSHHQIKYYSYKYLGRQAPRCRFIFAQQLATPHLPASVHRRFPISLISALSLGSRRSLSAAKPLSSSLYNFSFFVNYLTYCWMLLLRKYSNKTCKIVFYSMKTSSHSPINLHQCYLNTFCYLRNGKVS
jgi:hypothetical protein